MIVLKENNISLKTQKEFKDVLVNRKNEKKKKRNLAKK